MNKTLILSLGSRVMSDDAIGHVIVQNLQQKKVKADIIQLDTDIFKLNLFFDNHKRIIIIDAIQSSDSPGTVHVIPFHDFEKEIEGKIRGSHFLDMKEGLELLRIANSKIAEAEIFLVGIVIKKIELGTDLTPVLLKKIDEVCNIISDLII
ncbi:MAG: hydrogenase maturation protease [Candidatus Heimdallarchaeum aukensis]|uniref:Hydrogenase maturation protease n=1 Tax=Candidatus Heimdallarchaeum aukensis TaxID=2876573 RepID=A0A9Y1BMQ6_9ARCH|nr:MAG: hydrogenase maturation protease [Candidatus Heimdallarchaeum aukensis]